MDQLLDGQPIEITYLVNSPEIISHKGLSREEFHWEIFLVALLGIAAGIVSFLKKSKS